MPDPDGNVYVVGPGERGQNLIAPVAVFSTLEETVGFVKRRWDVDLAPDERLPYVWFGRRERENPVDLIFAFRLGLGAPHHD